MEWGSTRYVSRSSLVRGFYLRLLIPLLFEVPGAFAVPRAVTLSWPPRPGGDLSCPLLQRMEYVDLTVTG